MRLLNFLASVLRSLLFAGLAFSIAGAAGEYLERAKAIWEELGLPGLKPQSPWFGYNLVEWPDELERAAQLAVQGDYFKRRSRSAAARTSP